MLANAAVTLPTEQRRLLKLTLIFVLQESFLAANLLNTSHFSELTRLLMLAGGVFKSFLFNITIKSLGNCRKLEIAW